MYEQIPKCAGSDYCTNTNATYLGLQWFDGLKGVEVGVTLLLIY